MKFVRIINQSCRVAIIFILFTAMLSNIHPFKLARAQAGDNLIYLPVITNGNAVATPTGGRVVMVVYESGNYDLYSMQPDGVDRVRLTTTSSDVINLTPAWSADRSKIAFARHNNVTGRERGIYVMNADGTDLVRLTNSDTQGYDYAPSWSPDGDKIAYYTTNSNRPQIIVMNSDGSNPQQLTDIQSSQSPHWSPDGAQIVYASNQYDTGNARMEIYVMDADGGNKTRLTFNPESDDGNPRWSPDGTKIAFWSYRGGEGGTYIMDADGSNVTRVPNMAEAAVTWSPEGDQLMFVAQPDSSINLEIYTINTDGSALSRITETEGLLEDSPYWAP